MGMLPLAWVKVGSRGEQWRNRSESRLGSFYGAERFSIDHKGRVAIPARLRRALAPEARETFVIVPGFDGCLALYPLDEWRRTEDRLRTLPPGDARARRFKRMLLVS